MQKVEVFAVVGSPDEGRRIIEAVFGAEHFPRGETGATVFGVHVHQQQAADARRNADVGAWGRRPPGTNLRRVEGWRRARRARLQGDFLSCGEGKDGDPRAV